MPLKPIVLDYHGDLVVCPSLSRAEEYLEPDDVGNVDVYDVEGRLLRASVAGSWPHLRTPIFGRASSSCPRPLLLKRGCVPFCCRFCVHVVIARSRKTHRWRHSSHVPGRSRLTGANPALWP
jgi:hypothetical protein